MTEAMKTGIELIAQERREQIEKHGFTFEKYDRYYVNGELLQAACWCLDQAETKQYFARPEDVLNKWPKNWDIKLKIQADMIEAQRIENVRITSNFMERLKLGQEAFDAQKAIADSLAKDNRKKNRGIKALKVGLVAVGVGGLFLGSQF